MAEAMGIAKKYRERRVQLNRPVQCGGKSNITEKNRNIASMCEHLGRCSAREKRCPSLIPLYVWLGGQQGRERGHPNAAGSPVGIPIRWEPGNRGKTPDRAVGSPGHLGHLTPPPHEERQVSNPKKNREERKLQTNPA